MAPRLTNDYLNEYYGSAIVYAYGSDNPADYEAVIADKMGMVGKFVASVSDAPQSGLAVDYGAGAGSTVKALSNLGFDAVGVEISAKSRATATALFGIDVRDGDLAQFADDSIALLTMFDVMEHLLEPLAFAKQLHGKIQPGGLVMIGVPNFNSLDRQVRGVNSQVMVFPEHVNHFTKSSLTRLMEMAGFDVRYIGSPPPYGVAISLGIRRTMVKIFGRNVVTRALSGALAQIKRYVVYPLPNLIVERSGLFGHSLLVLAQKRAPL
ncbi:class I SAM-dependent methyltransferase [Asticcacaulis benevestitus]|nr:class I SAM-dependent methyltransferase [Asticcacaulis benevestitus]